MASLEESSLEESSLEESSLEESSLEESGFLAPALSGSPRRGIARLSRQATQEEVNPSGDDRETDHDPDPVKHVCH
jgi:hypothetical protein